MSKKAKVLKKLGKQHTFPNNTKQKTNTSQRIREHCLKRFRGLLWPPRKHNLKAAKQGGGKTRKIKKHPLNNCSKSRKNKETNHKWLEASTRAERLPEVPVAPNPPTPPTHTLGRFLLPHPSIREKNQKNLRFASSFSSSSFSEPATSRPSARSRLTERPECHRHTRN